uniref:1,3-beta-D-glucan glucanohydrolase n=1 Tax=Solanum tuberosum TaxID=4113 RepID=Q43162_SOLTU|nr:1,3-beta-D-glucan glucanohydrolase [Solanum tuberosum]
MSSLNFLSSEELVKFLNPIFYLLLNRGSIRCCYGMMGNNLPSHSEVIQLYKSRNIGRLRLYDPNHGALNALRGSNIEVILGLPNVDLKHIASGMEHARWWVQKNVKDFWPDVKIKYIALRGSESHFHIRFCHKGHSSSLAQLCGSQQSCLGVDSFFDGISVSLMNPNQYFAATFMSFFSIWTIPSIHGIFVSP